MFRFGVRPLEPGRASALDAPGRPVRDIVEACALPCHPNLSRGEGRVAERVEELIETPAILLQSVTKTFGETRAVGELSLEIPRGRLYGLIGPNGAGKTTAIRMIMSILQPDCGRVSVLGHDSALEAKDRIGYLPEERGLYRKMRVGAFLEYVGRLKGVSASLLAERVGWRLAGLGLEEYASRRCEELSKGTQQKIQFMAAVIHDPDLLILDEPFSGLDPVSTLQLRKLILAEHDRGATIVFSTHVMAHAEELCDHIVMIHRGRKVLDDPIAEIRSRYDPRTIRLEPLDPNADGARLTQLPEVEQVERDELGLRIGLAPGTDPAAALAHVAAVVPCCRIELARPTLEEIFLRVASGGSPAPETVGAHSERPPGARELQ
jgi:ABC-2 type transport system ATP-binding protein